MGWRQTDKGKGKGKKSSLASKVVVQAVQTAANTFRYVAKKVSDTFDNEEISITYGKRQRKKKARTPKKPIVIHPTFESHGSAVDQFVNGRLKRNHSYVNNYVAPKAKAAYAWQPEEWASFNWNSYYSYSKDTDNNLFVKEPENYLTPTNEQIKAKVNVYKDESLITIKEAARVCYFKMLDDRDYINPDHNVGSSTYDQKKALYDSIYETYIPGNTPLDQAIAIYWKQMDTIAWNNRVPESKRRSSHTVDFKREDYADASVNHQLDDNYLSRRYKMDILNKISILGDLGNQFKVEKEVGEYEVDYSESQSMRTMKSFEEFDRILLYQHVIPNFDHKFYTKDLFVSMPVTTTERKQKIIILLDFSASMNENEKQQWVNAILVDRFRYVMKGEAEIYFSLFLSNPEHLEFQHLQNAEDVNNFWKTFSNVPNGNSTNMGRIVDHISEDINNGRLCNLNVDLSKDRPEILIINDGQDSVGRSAFSYKVNAISLISFSSELKGLCLATSGKQVQITRDKEVYSYAIEDDEEVKTLVYQG